MNDVGKYGPLFDLFFDNGYNRKLAKTRLTKKTLRNIAHDKLDKLTEYIDESKDGYCVLKDVCEKLESDRPYIDYAYFGMDFPLGRKGRGITQDCLLFAELVVAALENIGRNDIVKNISVKWDYEHIWLEYKSAKGKISMDRFFHNSDIDYGVEALATAGQLNMAIHLYEKGHLEDSLRACEKGLKFTNTANIWSMKGTVLKAMGKNEDALSCYERSLELDKMYAPAKSGRGNLLKKCLSNP